MRIHLGEEEQPEIGLIALIDCIFFLLMFFMVATSFEQQEDNKKMKELPVILPTSTASLNPNNAAPDPLIIGVDRAGKFYWGEEQVSTQEMHDRLRKEAVANPKRRVRIDGDNMTPYQNIVHLLDLCQFEGLTNIAMHTRN